MAIKVMSDADLNELADRAKKQADDKPNVPDFDFQHAMWTLIREIRKLREESTR